MTTRTQPAIDPALHRALTALGWHAGLLSTQAHEQLALDGYLIVPDVIPAADLEPLRRAYDRIVIADQRSDEFLIDLLAKDALFLRTIQEPQILDAVGHVLGWDLKVHSVHGRHPGPGSTTQAVHYDWPVGLPHRPLAPGETMICNTAWMLDGMRADNGPTRVVPGSHRRGGAPADEMADLHAPHPREVHVHAPAGSVLIFNGSLWHSGMANHSGAPRRVVHTAFIRRDLPQPEGEVQRTTISPSLRDRLSPAQRYLLDC